MTTTELKPWERQPGEKEMWFARFEIYRKMGSNRTYRAAYNEERRQQGKPPMTKGVGVPGSWQKALDEWRWEERAEAWDAHRRAEIAAEESERERQEREVQRKRNAEARKKTTQAVNALLNALLQTYTKKDESTGQTVIKPPDPKDMRDIAAATEKVIMMSRLEFGEPTSSSEVDITSKGEKIATSMESFAEVLREMREFEKSMMEGGDE